MIDADYFRAQFPEYNGKNSSVFQKASSWLVEQSLKYVLEHGYSFILEDTFAILSAEKNIIRALKNNFRVTIFYVYQDRSTDWNGPFCFLSFNISSTKSRRIPFIAVSPNLISSLLTNSKLELL